MYKTLVNFLQGWVGTNLISRRQPEEDSVDSEAAFPFFFCLFLERKKNPRFWCENNSAVTQTAQKQHIPPGPICN